MKAKEPNVHMISAFYVGPGNVRGSRLKLRSERFGQTIFTSWNYSLSGVSEQARAVLLALGYKIVCSGETPKGFIFACDEDGPNWTGLKEKLAAFKGR